jgi:hypothetical protein
MVPTFLLHNLEVPGLNIGLLRYEMSAAARKHSLENQGRLELRQGHTIDQK